MNSYPSQISNEELQAGCAIGDLSPEEWAIFNNRTEVEGLSTDEQLEWIAVQLDIQAALQSSDEIPASLIASLHKSAATADFKQAIISPEKNDMPSAPATLPISNRLGMWGGWAAAACLAVALVLQSKKPNYGASNQTISVTNSPSTLAQSAQDMIRWNMVGAEGTYQNVSGEVLWSDQQQQGYLLLSGIPVNNPQDAQYQLWIVDPARDAFPVDGGVFDIVADATGRAQIDIKAKLAVRTPQAFVITREQPGGVVRSKQEVVVAIAKR